MAAAKVALIKSLSAIAPLSNDPAARVVVSQVNDLINAVEALANWMTRPEPTAPGAEP